MRTAIAVVSVLAALGAAEIGLRLFHPGAAFVSGNESVLWRDQSDFFKAVVIVDPDLGYRPRPGSQFYDEFGLLRTGEPHTLARTADRQRLLFLGDSATQRRTIELAARARLGSNRDYWNAGVEGYNTRQEVGYYARYLQPTQPDEVVLTLHNNDFENTPVVFFDEQDRIRVFTTEHASRGPNLWLFRHSYVYRLGYGLWLGVGGRRDFEQAAGEVRDSLRSLRDLLAVRQIRLAVLVLPIMAPPAEWSGSEQRNHDRALAILIELGIPHCDLLPALAHALLDGVEVQERPGDRLHGSREVAMYFVDLAIAQGLLR